MPYSKQDCFMFIFGGSTSEIVHVQILSKFWKISLQLYLNCVLFNAGLWNSATGTSGMTCGHIWRVTFSVNTIEANLENFDYCLFQQSKMRMRCGNVKKPGSSRLFSQIFNMCWHCKSHFSDFLSRQHGKQQRKTKQNIQIKTWSSSKIEKFNFVMFVKLFAWSPADSDLRRFGPWHIRAFI